MKKNNGQIKISLGVVMLLVVITILITFVCVKVIDKNDNEENITNTNTNTNANANTSNSKNNAEAKNEVNNTVNENVQNSQKYSTEKELTDLLKGINKEEKENDTYGSTVLELSKITKKTDNSYIAKIDIYESVKITESEYNKLKSSGKISINDMIFEYKEKSSTGNADFETIVGTGEKKYLEYDITKVGDKYELRGLAGPALPMYKLQDTKDFIISKDIEVANQRNDGIDKLSEFTDEYLSKNKTSVEFYNNQLRLYVDNK